METPDWIIRRMEERDLDQTAELEKQIFSVPWSREGFARALEQKGTIYLAAVRRERVLGYCGLWGVLDEGEITNVAVSPEARNAGIGRALLKELIRQAETEGLRKLFLEVRESNEAARRLYERCGFRTDGRRKNFYDRPKEDAVLMSFDTED